MAECVKILIIGSGAAGLAAAVRLKSIGEDPLVCTEGLDMGTSINTGSDKQTYYKLSLDGSKADSVVDMAHDLFAGGAVHGDIALVEASLSAVAFSNLVSLGVAFPHDEFGRFVGYKTDHDLRSRATSAGPYTSRDMCRQLIREAQRLGVSIKEELVAVKLLVNKGRAIGAIFVRTDCDEPTFEVVLAEKVIFATGGPGGLYSRSVYPGCHTGGIGLALLEGAEARNLAESQFGMASVKFRWNVSGSYMQVIPEIYSVDESGERHFFVRDFFGSDPAAWNAIFLKGYQWPFSAGNIHGSSLIDILVYIESVERNRRVFLDYRTPNSQEDFPEKLSGEAREYLEKSNALQFTPFERLMAMNPKAVELYRDHGIDLETEPLEIAVCAQHNNGGLAGDIWWRSTNIDSLYPIGEVNGSHGVTRPGGSALNAGQVGAWRAAEMIARRAAPSRLSLDDFSFARGAEESLKAECQKLPTANWREIRLRIQERMDKYCGFARSADALPRAIEDAKDDLRAIISSGLSSLDSREVAEALRTRQLAAASLVYLTAALIQVRRSGSRGGAIALGNDGEQIDSRLDDKWRTIPERQESRKECTVVKLLPNYEVEYNFEPCRPVPDEVGWFEVVWKDFLSKDNR